MKRSQQIKGLVVDALFVAGMAAIVAGVAMISIPAALIVGGGLVAGGAFLLGRSA